MNHRPYHRLVEIKLKLLNSGEVSVYWQLSTDKWEAPQHFVVFRSLELPKAS